MQLRVGIILDGKRQLPSLKWGNNQAVLENGTGLGVCLVPAESYLRSQINRKRNKVGGDYLYWFDADNPSCWVTFEELNRELESKYPNQQYKIGSPKFENLTKILKHIFKRDYEISNFNEKKSEKVSLNSRRKNENINKTKSIQAKYNVLATIKRRDSILDEYKLYPMQDHVLIEYS
jgi:hypothetical protein